MLVLSRCLGEHILIGNEIIVTVVDIRGSVVRIGIVAPDDVDVDRPEIREAKERSRRESEPV